MNAYATPPILRLDVTGQPVRWVPWQDAVVLESRSMIAWSAGEHLFSFRGGINRITGTRSQITVSSIIAVRGRLRGIDEGALVPPLSAGISLAMAPADAPLIEYLRWLEELNLTVTPDS